MSDETYQPDTQQQHNIRLVRIWDRNYNLRGQQFVNWHNGFTIPNTDPMAVELWDNRELQHQVTVESTNELAWYIDRLDRMAEGLLVVTCRPHLDVLRHSIRSDAYQVELWLAAEKQWKATRQSDNLRDRIAAVICDMDALHAKQWSLEVADAVIESLGLHMQYENSRVMYDEKPAACKENGLWKQRIVSPHEPYKE